MFKNNAEDFKWFCRLWELKKAVSSSTRAYHGIYEVVVEKYAGRDILLSDTQFICDIFEVL